MRWMKRTVLLFTLLIVTPLLIAACSSARLGADWRTADRSSADLAPDPLQHRDAVVQVYAARAFNWRGIFAVHTWIAVKPKDAGRYTVHEVIGWRARHGGPALVSHARLPDRRWYGAEPEVLREVRGDEAEALIPAIERAVLSYPYDHRYVMWPGPNSNTFVAHVGREVPGLRLDLPPTAIGKDFLSGGRVFGPAPSNTGWQLSLLGVLGLTVAVEEGLEVNIFSLGLGVDPLDLAIRLPGVGRVGVF